MMLPILLLLCYMILDKYLNFSALFLWTSDSLKCLYNQFLPVFDHIWTCNAYLMKWVWFTWVLVVGFWEFFKNHYMVCLAIFWFRFWCSVCFLGICFSVGFFCCCVVCLVGFVFGFGLKCNVRTFWFEIILPTNILMSRKRLTLGSY